MIGTKNPSVSAAWPAMKSRSRRAALEFAGIGEDRAYGYSKLDWYDLPSEAKSALLRGWNMGEIGGTTRRYAETTRRMPVLTNPTSGWAVTHDGETLKQFGPGIKGANAARAWLLQRQSQSIDWATKHEGYDIVCVKGKKVTYSWRDAMKSRPNPGSRKNSWLVTVAHHATIKGLMKSEGLSAKDATRRLASAIRAGELGPSIFPGSQMKATTLYRAYLAVEKAIARRKREGTWKENRSRRNGTKGAYPFKEKAEQYRKYTIAQLLYARKDAAEAARAMKGHDLAAENWYWDDSFTISDEITRRRHGLKNRARRNGLTSYEITEIKNDIKGYVYSAQSPSMGGPARTAFSARASEADRIMKKYADDPREFGPKAVVDWNPRRKVVSNAWHPMKPETIERRRVLHAERQRERRADLIKRLEEKAKRDPGGDWLEVIKEIRAQANPSSAPMIWRKRRHGKRTTHFRGPDPKFKVYFVAQFKPAYPRKGKLWAASKVIDALPPTVVGKIYKIAARSAVAAIKEARGL
jgi:hypothetical protein